MDSSALNTPASDAAPGISYLSGSHRSDQPQDSERVQSGSRAVVQSEHVDWEQQGEQVRLHLSPGGREQIIATFGADSRDLRRLTIQRFYTDTGRPGRDSISFDAYEAQQVVKLLEDIASGASQPRPSTVIDDEVLEALTKDSEALAKLYSRGGKQQLEKLVQSDAAASDIIAVAGRRAALNEFRELLQDAARFKVKANAAGGPEHVWQTFLQSNEWIFGLGLCHTFLQSWDPKLLEQTTTGRSISGAGKRVDALMKTTGLIRSLCFVEIKVHTDRLMQSDSNRSGVWAPSRALVEAVAQIQRTVDEAVYSIGKVLEEKDDDGYTTGRRAHLVYPRSFLVIGSLSELASRSTGGEHQDKIRSFELYRGSLAYPEIVTYDELLARAEYIVGGVQEAGRT